jgi:hypothetical protein
MTMPGAKRRREGKVIRMLITSFSRRAFGAPTSPMKGEVSPVALTRQCKFLGLYLVGQRKAAGAGP